MLKFIETGDEGEEPTVLADNPEELNLKSKPETFGQDRKIE